MCSTNPQRIAEIGKAIDDLAAEATAKPGPTRQAGHPAGAGDAEVSGIDVSDTDVIDTDQAVIRLAQLWARLAELDPEVARRLPRYQA